jgi:hypothetical protein
MSLLRIHRLRAAPEGYYWIVRFGGDDAEFWDMVRSLKAHYARWDRHAFGKKRGGWIVGHDTLLLFRDRFENYQQCIDREKLRQEREARRQRLADREQRALDLGIVPDINACPF